MHFFRKCPLNCGDGYVGFWRCGDGKRIILMCDECDALWLEPDDKSTKPPIAATPPDYLLAGTTISISGEKSGWASREEIEKAGWERFINGESAGLGDVFRQFLQNDAPRISEAQAVKIACEYLQKQGYDLSKQNPTAKFMGRPNADNPRAVDLKRRRPEVWDLIQRDHRDHWSVAFETGLPPGSSPEHFFVDVDAETGKITIRPVL